MRPSSIVTVALVATIAGSTALSAANAAVKTCTARLTSTAVQDATEQGAKKKALLDWSVKAVAAGIAHPAWRLAAERSLICQAVPLGKDGKPAFECIAVGHACGIVQNPDAAPRSIKPAPLKPAREI